MYRAARMKVTEAIASGAAHDFNSILTTMRLSLESLRQDLPETSPFREEVDALREGIERGTDLARQILTIGRSEQQPRAAFRLNELVQDVAGMIQRAVGKDIALEIRPAPDAGAVRADRGQIEHVLMALALNARDAMPQGGTLTIQTTRSEFQETPGDSHGPISPGSYVALAVFDTGCGMDQSTQERIFQPFFTTKKKGEGTGLGLFQAYQIVAQHDGGISVRSEPGQGTTFTIYLPRLDAAEAECPREDS